MSAWEDDGIQFPRLICELLATQEIDWDALCESMDLSGGDIDELLDRARFSWEQTKAEVREGLNPDD